MIRRTSSSALSILVISLANCTLWGVNQQGGGGEGTGSTTGLSGTTQVSNGEVPTSETSIDSTHSEPTESSSTTNDMADAGTTSSTTDAMTSLAETTLDDSSSDPTNDPSSDTGQGPTDNCVSNPENFVMINGDAADCRPRSDVRFVFVTSLSVAGNMDGGAPDSICNMLENVPSERPLPAPNKFKAWVSTEVTAPVSWAEFAHFTGPFVKYDTTDGAKDNSVVVVAENWKQFLDAGIAQNVLSAPIDVTELAIPISDDPNVDELVWTGTSPGGTLSYDLDENDMQMHSFNCSNWTTQGGFFCEYWSGLGEVGKVGAVNSEWTQYHDDECEDNRCNNVYSLYCIQAAV